MQMADVLNVNLREALGTSNTRRLRRAGNIPLILYGHGKENLNLVAAAEEVESAILHGAKLVSLSGAVDESALVREVQWNPMGTHVLHLDLTRVRADERVTTPVVIELRGVAPGTKQGGILQQPIHEVILDCPVTAIPEKIELNINALELGASLTIADLVVDEAVNVVSEADSVVVQCAEPAAEAEPDDMPAGAAEPELIGRRAESDEGEGDS